MRARTIVLFLATFTTSVFASGCGPDCTDSCQKIFGDKSDQCNIQIPGKTGAAGREEMVSACEAHCQHALKLNGDIGNYEPNQRASGDDDISLENEKQAALWMDCVAETSCDNLNDNYCAPVKNFPN